MDGHLGRIRVETFAKLYKRLVSDTIKKDRMAKGTKRKLAWKEEAGDNNKKNKMKERKEKNEEKEVEAMNEVEEGRKEEEKVTSNEGGESEDDEQEEKGLNEPLGDLSIDENKNNTEDDSDTSESDMWFVNSSEDEAEEWEREKQEMLAIEKHVRRMEKIKRQKGILMRAERAKNEENIGKEN